MNNVPIPGDPGLEQGPLGVPRTRPNVIGPRTELGYSRWKATLVGCLRKGNGQAGLTQLIRAHWWEEEARQVGRERGVVGRVEQEAGPWAFRGTGHRDPLTRKPGGGDSKELKTGSEDDNERDANSLDTRAAIASSADRWLQADRYYRQP